MSKDLKIFCPNRPSLIGDIIISLPLLNIFEQFYPDSYKIVYIDKKCDQIAPLLLNHPLIDKILISEISDQFSSNDQKIADDCYVVCNPYAQHVYEQDFYNYVSVQEETFRMTQLKLNDQQRYSNVDPRIYSKLKFENKTPRLNQWFDIDRKQRHVAILPFVGYDLNDPTSRKRSPSLDKWKEIYYMLKKEKYKVVQYGHPKSPKISADFDQRYLSLFEMIQSILGCDFVIGTDTGAMHILAAYGFPQICIYTNWKEDHRSNMDAFCPINAGRNLIKIPSINNINKFTIEDIERGIKDIKYKQ